MLYKVKKVIKKPSLIILKLMNTRIFNLCPDKLYIKLKYRLIMGKKLDLVNPKTYNEKLQWLKLYDRNPLYSKLVDKYEVRKYIKQKIGEEYLIPLIEIYDSFDEIDFNKLPEKFVLKCTHDSGSVVVCNDKNLIEINEIEKNIKKALGINFYYYGREWPYKNVKPRIVCEKMLDSKIIDYKIFCFNGKPKFLYVGQGLVSDHSLKIDFYDLEWNVMDFKRSDYDSFEKKLDKPVRFDEMIKIAEELSENIPFVRIDLYEVDSKIYFSEFTFTPAGGYLPFEPIEYDKKIGELLQLPEICK